MLIGTKAEGYLIYIDGRRNVFFFSFIGFIFEANE